MTTALTRVMIAGALFSSDGKLLLLHSLGGQWELPGGALEFGEEPEVGIVRVFNEVTGIEAVPDRPLGAASSIERDGERAEHVVQIAYTVTASGALLGVDIERERHSAFAWSGPAEVARYVESPALAKICRAAFATLARSRGKGN